MLHPVLESLFFLKTARNYVCESINNSDVDNAEELKNYIQNEASDFEIMHLVTLGEMPEEKYYAEAEDIIWDIFKRGVVSEFNNLKEIMNVNDINNIIFEMGPVSGLGYSSAAPILEFDRAQGRLDIAVLNEETAIGRMAASQKTKRKSEVDKKSPSELKNTFNKTNVAQQAATAGLDKKLKDKSQTVPVSQQAAQRGRDKDLKDNSKSGFKLTDAQKKAGKYGAVGVAGVAGLFGLYKLYKMYKAKKDAKGMAATQAKIKKAKAAA